MRDFVSRAVLLATVLAAPHAARSADSEFPVLNSIGRFLGVGYTRGGYQAAQDGRFDAMADRHPASNYRMGGLQRYSQPLYIPPPKAITPAPVMAPTPAIQKPGDKNSAPTNSGVKPGLGEVIVPPGPVAPTQPTEPPPPWLQDYLQEEKADKANEIPSPIKNTRPAESAPENSPSDRLFEQPADDALSDILNRYR